MTRALKETFGWLILVSVLGGLVFSTVMAMGWARAAIVWCASIAIAAALLLAIAWITD